MDKVKKIRDISGHGSTIFRLQFTPDGSQLITCSADKTARAFNPKDGKQIRSFDGHKDWVYSATIDPDGKMIATGSWDGEVRIWKIEDGALIKSFVAMPTEQTDSEVTVTGIPVEAVPASVAGVQVQ